MSNSLSRTVALLFLLTLALPATVLAQAQDTASLHGVVLDASGRPAAGYPMKITTQLWGEVIMHPTEDNGTFAASGFPPGNYELRVFEPGGSTDTPIASKQVTLAAGQAAEIEIRLGSDSPGSGAGRGTSGTTLGTSDVNWTAVFIAAMVISAALGVFFVARSQRHPGA